jgi:hypothetical protein
LQQYGSCSPVATISDTIFAEDANTFIIYKNLMRERNCICGSGEELGSTVGYFVSGVTEPPEAPLKFFSIFPPEKVGEGGGGTKKFLQIVSEMLRVNTGSSCVFPSRLLGSWAVFRIVMGATNEGH